MTLRSDCRPSRALMKLLAGALLDQELRERFFADREATAREFDLLPDEIDALKRLDRRKFERSATKLRWS
jgi:hypothetical protein